MRVQSGALARLHLDHSNTETVLFSNGRGAVWIFIHALPGARPEDIDQAEENVRGFPGPGELVREGLSADEIADRLLVGLGSRERHYSRPVFHCGCDDQRVKRAVALLGHSELRELQARQQPVEVRCEFCGERYEIDPADARSLLADA